MRKFYPVLLLIVSLFLSGCIINEQGTEQTTGNTAEVQTTTVLVSELTSAGAVTENTTSQPPSLQEQTTQPAVETTAEPTSDDIQTEADTTEEPAETVTDDSSVTEVELSIEMPVKNGTMETDVSSDNKFIKAVSSKRGIDTDRLVAVYAVPESGQNYVFEFYNDEDRGKDDLRRVFLLDGKCRITGVAASEADEREDISSVENWFCMNVLIKEVIFPAIENNF